jgi:hypothetical protein
MSLDSFFDEMEKLNRKCLVTMPCSFVKTKRLNNMVMPLEYQSLIEKYFPQYEIIRTKNCLVVKS